MFLFESIIKYKLHWPSKKSLSVSKIRWKFIRWNFILTINKVWGWFLNEVYIGDVIRNKKWYRLTIYYIDEFLTS